MTPHVMEGVHMPLLIGDTLPTHTPIHMVKGALMPR